MFGDSLVEDFHDIIALEPPGNPDGEATPRAFIYQNHQPEAASVVRAVVDEVPAPHVVRLACRGGKSRRFPLPPAFRWLPAHLEPFLAPDFLYKLPADLPAFPCKQGPDTAVAVPGELPAQVDCSLPELDLVWAPLLLLVVEAALTESQVAACPAATAQPGLGNLPDRPSLTTFLRSRAPAP